MAIHISLDTDSVTCDSVEEAADLIVAMRMRSTKSDKAFKPRNAAEVAAETAPTGHARLKDRNFCELWQTLDATAKTFFRKLSETDAPIETGTLAEQIGTDVPKLGWVRRRLVEAVGECGFDFSEFVSTSKVKDANGKPKTAYQPTRLLKDEIQHVKT